MNTVTMRHAELGEMQVHPLTVPSWRSRGWQAAAEQAIPPSHPDEETADQESPRRRRTKKESE